MSIDNTYLAEPEVRVTNEATGGQKGAKLTQLGALDPASLIELARVAGMGANKYSAYNFMKGTDWSLMYNAMQRHALRFWSGEDVDPESQLLHIAHAAWMALALVSFSLRDLGNDDRPPALLMFDPLSAVLEDTMAEDEEPKSVADWKVEDGTEFIGYGTGLLHPAFKVDVVNRGEWPEDTRVGGLLTCCGASEHTIECPQWR